MLDAVFAGRYRAKWRSLSVLARSEERFSRYCEDQPESVIYFAALRRRYLSDKLAKSTRIAQL